MKNNIEKLKMLMEQDEPKKEVSSKDIIKALKDTDYRDKEAFFKMSQLLKGLAVASEKDETAKKFMSAVSDALTGVAKEVLGEEDEGEDSDSESKKKVKSESEEENEDGIEEMRKDFLRGGHKKVRADDVRDWLLTLTKGATVNSPTKPVFKITVIDDRVIPVVKFEGPKGIKGKGDVIDLLDAMEEAGIKVI